MKKIKQTFESKGKEINETIDKAGYILTKHLDEKS